MSFEIGDSGQVSKFQWIWPLSQRPTPPTLPCPLAVMETSHDNVHPPSSETELACMCIQLVEASQLSVNSSDNSKGNNKKLIIFIFFFQRIWFFPLFCVCVCVLKLLSPDTRWRRISKAVVYVCIRNFELKTCRIIYVRRLCTLMRNCFAWLDDIPQSPTRFIVAAYLARFRMCGSLHFRSGFVSFELIPITRSLGSLVLFDCLWHTAIIPSLPDEGTSQIIITDGVATHPQNLISTVCQQNLRLLARYVGLRRLFGAK